MNAATALEAAGWLLMTLGVMPDLDTIPGDKSEGGRLIRNLMTARATIQPG